MKRIIVTGAAGFIGFHFCRRLLSEGFSVLGIDNLNEYYDVSLKNARLARLEKSAGFEFHRLCLTDPKFREEIARFRPEYVVNLAAQAGVRYSLINPSAYVEANVAGFVNLLEALKATPPRHLIYASSSSVYGLNASMPFSTRDRTDHPASLYAATKKANELLAHVYSHQNRLPVTGLRFFTVYGSWGRPDMAYFSFAEKIIRGQPIDLFNSGEMRRDFTHISDIVESMIRLLDKVPSEDPVSRAPARVFNIGASTPVQLREMVSILEEQLGRRAEIRLLPMQTGDVVATYADVEDLEREVGYRPQMSLREGLEEFTGWFKEYSGQ